MSPPVLAPIEPPLPKQHLSRKQRWMRSCRSRRAPSPACSKRCATRRWAAASGCARFSCCKADVCSVWTVARWGAWPRRSSACSYSLIHDDLLAMDDDVRRGKPSLHKPFDEATAILAGDALLTLAFGLVASSEAHGDPFVRCELITRLALATGHGGMVGGQMMDIALEGEHPPLPEITRLARMKTAALLTFCCEAGAIMGRLLLRRAKHSPPTARRSASPIRSRTISSTSKAKRRRPARKFRRTRPAARQRSSRC